MKLESSYPVICTDQLEATRNFYITHFDFEPTFEADWYVSLKSKSNPALELALLDYRHESLPEAYRHKTRGLLINFEVADVDAVYRRLIEGELSMVLNLKSEAWGQRHFITTDPNDILIDVIQNIEPSAEFAGQYSG